MHAQVNQLAETHVRQALLHHDRFESDAEFKVCSPILYFLINREQTNRGTQKKCGATSKSLAALKLDAHTNSRWRCNLNCLLELKPAF